MTIRPLTAAIALALAGGNAAATVILPNAAGGSELVFYMSDADSQTTAYSLDLGVQMGSFNFTQSQAFDLGQGFASAFLGSGRYQDSQGNCGAGTGRMCALPPTLPNGPFPDYSIVTWGVVAANTTNGSADQVLMTWSDNNMGDTANVSSDNVNFAANNLADTLGPDSSAIITRLNERAGHAGAANGSDLVFAENLTLQQQANDIPSIMGGQIFDSIPMDLRASMDEQLPMYLFTETSGSPTVALQGVNGTEFGKWYLDFTNARLIYEAVGSPVPPPSAVPVPAAAWLFGSALLGMAGISRRRAGCAA